MIYFIIVKCPKTKEVWSEVIVIMLITCVHRCPQSEAYERRQDPNGMYMKHLLKHVMNDTKVEDVLHQVASGRRPKIKILKLKLF